MLFIDYGRPDSCIDNSDMEFGEVFEYEWLEDEFVLRIIREIDNAIVDGTILYDAEETDRKFSIFEISGGAKALILMFKTEYDEFWGPLFGDNCSGLILEIAEKKDITIYMEHLLQFPEDSFEGYSKRLKRKYDNYDDFMKDAIWGVTECMLQ